VALGNVHWTDGTLFDLEAIGERARRYGAALVVDGTQSVGALPFDVQRVRPDALICASYKWLLGPYSLGLAYLGARFDDGEPLEETWLGRLGSEDFGSLVNYRDEYQPGALRFDMGARSSFSLMPMLNAALERLLDWRPAEIRSYCQRLLEPLAVEAESLGFQVEEERWRGGHMMGIRAGNGIDLDAVQRRLAERRIGVSRRGSALRIAPHLYNDEADIDALIGALRG
jgi:selenocysteine lyase/cysteine desulfurase